MIKHRIATLKTQSVQLFYWLLMVVGVWLPIIRIKENRVVRGDTYRLWNILSEPSVFNAQYSVILQVVVGSIFLLPLIIGLLLAVQNICQYRAGVATTHRALTTVRRRAKTEQGATSQESTTTEPRLSMAERSATAQPSATERRLSMAEPSATAPRFTAERYVVIGFAGCSALLCVLLLVLCGPLLQVSATISTSARMSVESGWLLAMIGGVLLLYRTAHTMRAQFTQLQHTSSDNHTNATTHSVTEAAHGTATTLPISNRRTPRLRFQRALAYGCWIVLPVVAGVGVAVGWFNHFGIFKEFVNNQSRFFDELSNHLFLSLSAVGIALMIGVPLGILAWRSRRGRTPIFLLVNTVQTIPSLALFGLIIAPLAVLTRALPALRAIGIKGIGNTPALIALSLYALLPIVQGTFTGLGNIKRSIIDAGEGMGMTKRQIWYSIELPLSFPIMLSGIRTAAIQTIGNAAIAALIGASGLGNFIFRGLGQAALDLIILGVLPIVIIAVGADALFSAGIKRLKISKIVMAT